MDILLFVFWPTLLLLIWIINPLYVFLLIYSFIYRPLEAAMGKIAAVRKDTKNPRWGIYFKLSVKLERYFIWFQERLIRLYVMAADHMSESLETTQMEKEKQEMIRTINPTVIHKYVFKDERKIGDDVLSLEEAVARADELELTVIHQRIRSPHQRAMARDKGLSFTMVEDGNGKGKYSPDVNSGTTRNMGLMDGIVGWERMLIPDLAPSSAATAPVACSEGMFLDFDKILKDSKARGSLKVEDALAYIPENLLDELFANQQRIESGLTEDEYEAKQKEVSAN